MPTYLRLIIMLGEIIGFSIYSIIFIFYRYNKLKEDTEEVKLKSIIKSDSIFFGILNIILICVFCFSFPNLIFLSYWKMICLSAIELGMIAIIIGAHITDTHAVIAAIMVVIAIIGFAALICTIVFSFSKNEPIPVFKKVITQNEEIKVSYFIDKDEYLEKHILSKKILNEEKRETDKDYIVTTEDVFYILHTGDNQEIKLIETD